MCAGANSKHVVSCLFCRLGFWSILLSDGQAILKKDTSQGALI